MRCIDCGLPLSPTRTNCPRCGTPVPVKQPRTTLPFTRPRPPQQGLSPSPTYESSSPTSRVSQRSIRLGLTISGVCLCLAMLILVFVYLMSQSFFVPPSNIQATSHHKNTTSAQPTKHASATVVASPTAPVAGQQYITNAQIASAIDMGTAQPTQLNTNFKANQQIFVTFSVQTAGQGGAACLYWYVNKQLVTKYAVTLSPTAGNTYAYGSINDLGLGYIEIYWASTTQCTDKMLAQHVDFVVSA